MLVATVAPAAAGVFASSSLSRGVLLTMLPFASALAIASLGQTLVVMQGGIDLSIAGGLSLYVVIVTKYPNGDDSRLLAAIGIAFLAAIGAGLLNGLLIGRMLLNPIVATLGTMRCSLALCSGTRAAYRARRPLAWRESAAGSGSVFRLRCTSPWSRPPSSRRW